MTMKEHIFGLIDARRKVRRPPLVRMQFLHQGPVGPTDLEGSGSGLKPKDLIGLILGHWPRPRRSALPRCRIGLRVLTPGGVPAVKIRCK